VVGLELPQALRTRLAMAMTTRIINNPFFMIILLIYLSKNSLLNLIALTLPTTPFLGPQYRLLQDKHNICSLFNF
jgi:hypothetical protein